MEIRKTELFVLHNFDQPNIAAPCTPQCVDRFLRTTSKNQTKLELKMSNVTHFCETYGIMLLLQAMSGATIMVYLFRACSASNYDLSINVHPTSSKRECLQRLFSFTMTPSPKIVVISCFPVSNFRPNNKTRVTHLILAPVSSCSR